MFGNHCYKATLREDNCSSSLILTYFIPVVIVIDSGLNTRSIEDRETFTEDIWKRNIFTIVKNSPKGFSLLAGSDQGDL